jgi:hypothetical protein
MGMSWRCLVRPQIAYRLMDTALRAAVPALCGTVNGGTTRLVPQFGPCPLTTAQVNHRLCYATSVRIAVRSDRSFAFTIGQCFLRSRAFA